MKSLKKDNIVDIMLIVFLILQPIFDLKIFYNSISTLIRVILILGLFGYYFIKSDNKKKYILLVYPIVLGIYFIFHHLNALKFNSLVPGNFNYSLLNEALYFLKMICPFMLIYSLFKSKLDNKTYIKIIKTLVLIISLIIIISNIFMFSYGSYSGTKIKANFFNWFNTDYTYFDLASIGLFLYGNQISAILIMFLPFTIFSALNCETKDGSHTMRPLQCKINFQFLFTTRFFNIFTLVCNIFALILICTKVSVLGIFVAFAYTIFTFIFISIINKSKFKVRAYVPILAIFIIYGLLLPINPMFNRMDERKTAIQASTEVSNDVTISEPTTNNSPEPEPIQEEPTSNEEVQNSSSNEMMTYIENNYETKKLHKQFLYENYPYQYDPEFWYNFLQNDVAQTTDYRYIEKSMVKRVIEINNNPMDVFFGITNTRLQNIFNIERDFVVQYYALGIIGLILVFFPYFAMCAYFVYKIIRVKLKNLTLMNMLSFITIIFIFGISYFSGNLLNSLNFTIYFTIMFKLLYDSKSLT